ncbi:Cold-regulated protein [Thalictrum thalictroides]|uniref:Cold-regulated protein n=1 Tax=Thalictrum thalictroides TaxID=46969 RepID=A0A7J6W211_THATH|nr:Cold-regulated protein [Thalictrum thalictroides]
MGRTDYIAMKTDEPAAAANYDSLNSDIKELKLAAKKFANHAAQLLGAGFATSFLQWLAAIAAIYLLVLDRTNWKTNMLTSLLVPYIFLTLPSILFNLLRGEVGKWIAFIAVVLKLFFPKHYPEWLDMPSQLIILLVVAPSLFTNYVRGGWIGLIICFIVGCYLLQEHIRACGGFRNAFTKANGISNAIGIVLLFVYPVWALIVKIL